MEKKKTNQDNKQSGKGLFGKQKPFFKAKGKPADGKSTDTSKASGKSAGSQKTGVKSASDQKPAVKPASRPNIPAEWLYMSPQQVTVRSLKDALDPVDFADIEIWEDAGVLEIALGEKSSFDIETVDPPVMDDDFSNAYLKEHDIKSLFMVTISPESFDKAQKAMHQIIAGCGGFFCGDTENFMPQVK